MYALLTALIDPLAIFVVVVFLCGCDWFPQTAGVVGARSQRRIIICIHCCHSHRNKPKPKTVAVAVLLGDCGPRLSATNGRGGVGVRIYVRHDRRTMSMNYSAERIVLFVLRISIAFFLLSMCALFCFDLIRMILLLLLLLIYLDCNR